MSAYNGLYDAIGRCTNGVTVDGYILRNISTGKITFCERSITEQLAINKQIKNIAAQVYEGRIIMKGQGCKLSTLPNYTKECDLKSSRICGQSNSGAKTVICARISDGKNTVGYVIKRHSNISNAEYRRMSRVDTIMMARDGKIDNARVQMSAGKPVLRGVNCELTRLKVLSPNETKNIGSEAYAY